MNLDGPDGGLRAAAFAWLSRVTEGGELPVSWRDLTTGFMYDGEAVALIGQQGIWKPRQAELPLAIVTAPPRSDHGAAPYDERSNR
jgi:hypothetical protein